MLYLFKRRKLKEIKMLELRNNGKKVTAQNEEAEGVAKCPNKIWHLKFDARAEEYYLDLFAEKYEVGEIYGEDHNERKFKVLNAFDKLESNVGVISMGKKGNGKSLLSKDIANTMLRKNMPVIIVTALDFPELFLKFVEKIDGAMYQFEEFEKYIHHKDQQKLLNIFDGVTDSKNLFFITTNSKHNVETNLFGRPSRIRYIFNFNNLSEDAIIEYIEKNLTNLRFKEDLTNWAINFSEITFDILTSIVTEFNITQPKEMQEVLKDFNVTSNIYSESSMFSYTIIENGKDVTPTKVKPIEIDTSREYFHVKRVYEDPYEEEEDKAKRLESGEENTESTYFYYNKMQYKKNGQIIIKNADGQEITLSKIKHTFNPFLA